MFSTPSYDDRDWTTGVTSQTDDDDYDDWPISKPLKILYTVLFSTVFAIGVIGNTLVIMVILKTKNMRNSINIMLVNLAVADILTLIVKGTERLYSLRTGMELLEISAIWCLAVNFFVYTLTYASVLTILAISVERYYAVCHPLKAVYICTNKRAYITCLLVWAIAALFSSLQFSFKYCVQYSSWSDSRERDTHFIKSYYIIYASAFFLLPLVVFIVLFTIIVRHLNVTVAPNVNIAAMRHRRHVTTMLATVVLCFVLCQLPEAVRYLLYAFALDDLVRLLGVRGYSNVFYFCRFMLYLHSAINPVLYNFMSERFRVGFKNIFSPPVNGLSRWRRA